MPLDHHVRVLVLLLAALVVSRIEADDAEPSSTETSQNETRIAALIEQLGSAEFPERESAKKKLAQIGLSAFDALHEAQFHRDLEVGLQARYLVRTLVTWVQDDDPPEVKSILRGYGEQLEPERKTRIEKLARLNDQQGWPALCRLARFETEEPLSKQAALAILTYDPPPTGDHIPKSAEQLENSVGQSRRRAAQWLRLAARSLRDPESTLAEWNQLVHEEFEVLASQTGKTSPEVLLELARWHATTLKSLDREEDLKAVVKRLDGMIHGSAQDVKEKLLDHVDWLGHRDLWPYVVAAAADYEALFNEDPLLLYRLAEAQRRLDDKSAAETASRAMALNGEHTEAHIQSAIKLAERGLFDWAEAEYNWVLEKEPIDSMPNLRSRFLLSEMLHDQQKEGRAADTLDAVVQAMKDPQVKETILGRLGREPGGIESRMHYFRALDLLAKNERAKAREHLDAGVKADATDADVLIALYRLPEQPDEQKARTRNLIRTAAAQFQQEIVEDAQSLAQAQVPVEREYYGRQLAMDHNQFAWLVSNTEGDYEAAVASSHESLKLRPGEPAYLDTLGRCYYAKGDLENAIKYQMQAVRKEPYAGQMARQLAQFKSELEKRK